MTERQDFTKYRVALVEYNHEGVYDHRSIHIEATPVALLREVGSHVLQCAETLLVAYPEYFDDEHISSLFDPDLACPLLAECHSREDIISLLHSMLKSHEGYLAESSHDASILGEWYTELTRLNDVWLCDTNPPDNYIRVVIEDDLPSFVERLLLHEANRFDPRLVLVKGDEERFQAVGFSRNARPVDDESAVRLGQLLVLSQATDWQWQENAVYLAFCKWADAFNERNEGR